MRRVSAVERELSSVAQEIREHEAAADRLKPKRDRLIRRAIEAKIPRSRIIALTELSSARIEQIRRGSGN